jgi:predicted membrane-bound spermidine synthase
MVAAAAAFFASGFAALVYQVAWQRILALETGVGIYSIALIVAVFMAGLGMGSEIGGRASARLGNRGALRAFAAVELAIGLFGLASATIYYDWLYVRLGWLYASPWRAGLLHVASLGLPTALMGMSLPLLVRAMVVEGATAPRTIGVLYAINLAGASAGALLTPWVLIRSFGIAGALEAAAAANLAAGLVALAAGSSAASPVAAEVPAAGRAPASARPFAAWVLLYGLSGFCALGLEMAWFRVIDVTVKATAFTFGSVLAVYLAGAAAGTFAGVATVHRIGRPLSAFLACQCAILVYAAGSLLLLAALPADHGLLSWIAELSRDPRSYEAGARWRPADVILLYGLVPAVVYGIPTVLMGYSFVVLQRAVQDDPRTSGRKVGLLQAANIAGCVLGSLAVGLGTLAWLGTAGTVRLLAGIGALLALVGARVASRAFLAPAAALLVLALAGPANDRIWPRLHGLAAAGTMVDEDATGVVALAPEGEGWRLFVNGRSHSTLPFGGLHTTLGAAPAIVHPAPRSVAVIGLGSGDTAWAAGCRPETSRVRVFEICAPEHRLLRRLAATGSVPRLAAFLDDPRLDLVLADGRNALERGDETYDLIEMDALPPSSPSSGSLYSVEFFEMCRRRLRAGGLMCTWAPTVRVLPSFAAAFPHVLEMADGRVLIGSGSPLPVDLAAWKQRLDRPEVREYLGPARAERVWAHLAGAHASSRDLTAIEVNRDLHPRDEFNAR